MSTKYFKATFPNGDVVLRSSTSREYTHAWQVGGMNGWDWKISARRADKAWAAGGFAGREDLAVKASHSSGYDNAEYRYVVPCEEIDAKTYRELKSS